MTEQDRIDEGQEVIAISSSLSSHAASSNGLEQSTSTSSQAVTSSDKSEGSSSTSAAAVSAPATNKGGQNKLFALFDPEARKQQALLKEQESAASGSSASGSGKRLTRSRTGAAKPKGSYSQIDLTREDLDDDPFEDGLDVVNGGSTKPSKKKAKAKANGTKASAKTPPPVEPAKPLPPLKLDVKGTGLQPGQQAHSFFAKREKPVNEPATAKRSIIGTGSQSSSSMQPKRPKIPRSLPDWPTRDSLHNQPEDTQGDEQRALDWLRSKLTESMPFSKLDFKGKSRAIDNGPLLLSQDGLADRVRSAKSSNSSKTGSSSSSSHGQPTCAEILSRYPDPFAQRPALRSVLSAIEADNTATTSTVVSAPQHLLWTDRWRPRSAMEVIGNQDHAIFLRDWLWALKVQSSKDAATHAGSADRSRQSMQTSSLIDDDELDLLGPLTAPQQPPIASLAAGPLRFDPQGGLSNLIVLYGPPASGKTSAVFACAEELGFEVFEVFAGKGKRGGKELKEQVGDLGKNHMVGGGGSGGGEKRGRPVDAASGLKAMFAGNSTASSREAAPDKPIKKRKLVIPDSQDTPDEMALSQEDGHSKELNNDSPLATKVPVPHTTARQSLILIEEVDVLFRDEASFWQGLLDLVRSSRRPIVLTCNDLDFVPRWVTDQVVPQGFLPFEPVGITPSFLIEKRRVAEDDRERREEVLAYLELISRAQGRWIDRGRIESDILDHQQRANIDDQGKESSEGTTVRRGIDLRQAITQLQFLCSLPDTSLQLGGTQVLTDERQQMPDADASPSESHEDFKALRSVYHALSSLSFAEYHLAPSLGRDLAAEASDLARPSSIKLDGSSSGGSINALSSAAHPLSSCSPSSSMDSMAALDELLLPLGVRSMLYPDLLPAASPVGLPRQGRSTQIQRDICELAQSILPSAAEVSNAWRGQAAPADQSRDMTSFEEKVQHAVRQTYTILEAFRHPSLLPRYEHGYEQDDPLMTTSNIQSSTSTTDLLLQRGGVRINAVLQPYILDYLPYLRHLVGVEDAEEAQVEAQKKQLSQLRQEGVTIGAATTGGARFSTRLLAEGRGRGGFERVWDIGEIGLEIVRSSGEWMANSSIEQ